MNKALVFLIGVLYFFIYLQSVWLDDYAMLLTRATSQIAIKDKLLFSCQSKRLVYKRFTDKCVFEGR